MVCKQCGAPINQGGYICEKCGFKHRLEAEKARVRELKDRQWGFMPERCRGRLFLALCISYTLMALGFVFAVLCGNIIGIPSATFMLISLIPMWKAYFNRDGKGLAENLKDGSLFDAFVRLMHTALAAVAGVVFFGVAIVLFLIFRGDLSGGILDSLKGSTLTLIGGISVMVLGFLTVALLLVIRSVYAARRRYFLALADYSSSGLYTFGRPKIGGSYVMAGVMALFGLMELSFASFGDRFISAFSTVIGIAIPMLGFTADGFLAYALTSLFAGFVTCLSVKGISDLLIAVYLGISGFWMMDTHKRAAEICSQVDRQMVLRAECETQSSLAYERFIAEGGTPCADEAAEESAEETDVETNGEIAEEPAKEESAEEPAEEPVEKAVEETE